MIIIFILLSLYLGYTNQLEKYLAFLIALIILAQKVLPLMQKIYESLSLISTKDSFENIVNYLHYYQENLKINKSYDDKAVISNFQKLTFEDVYFKYETDTIFNSISFSIEKGEKVAIVGDSGSGNNVAQNYIRFILSSKRNNKVNNKELNFKEVLIRKAGRVLLAMCLRKSSRKRIYKIKYYFFRPKQHRER